MILQEGVTLTMDSSLEQGIADLEEEKVLTLVRQELESGTEPIEILKACQNGMELVGERFSRRKIPH